MSDFGKCDRCNQALIEIDHYGERLVGCIECCAKLAAAAATPELAAVLSDIAQKWAVLAAELDRTDRALASWQMPQPKRS